MNGTTRARKYREVSERDGEYCKGCHALPSEKQLILDHVDNNDRNNDNKNLQILCRGCNYIKNPRGGPLDLCESENEAPDQSELELNRLKEPAFKKYVYQRLNESGSRIPEKDLINSAAEVLGISPVTAKRYLDKMCSSAGTLRRSKSVKTVLVGYKKELALI